MAALKETVKYRLCASDEKSPSKTVIYVKLTDSALSALEECSQLKHLEATPRISFGRSDGSISIPVLNANGEANKVETRSFQFTLSSLQGDGLECVQYTDSNCLTSLGFTQKRMIIHATDDVYLQTKTKMALAEEESKKICTKVIKPGTPYGHKGRPRKSRAVIPPPKSQDTGGSHLVNSSAISYKHTPNSSPNSFASMNGHQGTHSGNTLQKTVNHNLEVLVRPYKERVLHLLAVRSYKKPELLARLMKDGIKEKDKNSLHTILSEIAVMKDNVYSLARYAYTDVDCDWPFYTDTDKQLLKRRWPSSTVNGECSPTTTEKKSPNSSISEKRSMITSPQMSKKKRISLYNTSPSSNHHAADLPSRNIKNGKATPTNKHVSPDSQGQENIHNGLSDDHASESGSVPHYKLQYTPITTPEQRAQYKADFNAEYDEYRAVHASLDKVSKKFAQLEDKLKETRKGSPEYIKTQKEILSEYKANKNDWYLERKKRWQYLHHKLAYIKQLVIEYDRNQMAVDL